METESLLPNNSSYSSGGTTTATTWWQPRWKPRRYTRLGAGTASTGTGGKKAKRRRMVIKVRGIRSSRRYWRIKVIPRLSLVVRTPLKLLRKLKNAYIDFMLKLAGNVGSLSGDNVFGQRRVPMAREVKKKQKFTIDAFEARLIYEISKVMVASRELNPSF